MIVDSDTAALRFQKAGIFPKAYVKLEILNSTFTTFTSDCQASLKLDEKSGEYTFSMTLDGNEKWALKAVRTGEAKGNDGRDLKGDTWLMNEKGEVRNPTGILYRYRFIVKQDDKFVAEAKRLPGKGGLEGDTWQIDEAGNLRNITGGCGAHKAPPPEKPPVEEKPAPAPAEAPAGDAGVAAPSRDAGTAAAAPAGNFFDVGAMKKTLDACALPCAARAKAQLERVGAKVPPAALASLQMCKAQCEEAAAK